MTTAIAGLIAIRIITADDAAFERTVGYYETLLRSAPAGDDGPAAPIRHARFDVGGVELVIAKEPEVTPEAGDTRQGAVWLCFAG